MEYFHLGVAVLFRRTWIILVKTGLFLYCIVFRIYCNVQNVVSHVVLSENCTELRLKFESA